jgi:hypothetical protein
LSHAGIFERRGLIEGHCKEHFSGFYFPLCKQRGSVGEMGQHVFISYANNDSAQATSVCDLLERNGIACWMAHRNIPPGDSWATAIGDAIDNASLMLVLISASSNSSRHGAREIERADRKQIPTVPLRIENVTPSESLGYFVAYVQWIDIFPGPIEAYWPKLSLAIKAYPVVPGSSICSGYGGLMS